MRRRLTARHRLAVLHTMLVLGTGLALTTLTYLLMRRNLPRRAAVVQFYTPAGAAGPPPDPGALPALTGQVRAVALAELLTQAAVALAVVTVLAAVLSWLIAGRVLRPIRLISATATRISAENLSERVPVTTPADELTALAGTLNGMLDRIQRGLAERDRALDSQRMFTANAAHELRTPLTTMRIALDVTLDGEPDAAELRAMADDIRAAVEHSQRTLDGLLALARSQAGPRRRSSLDLATVAAATVHAAAGDARGRGVALRRELRPAPVDGEPTLLERMTANLVDNAVRYNHRGGHVTVETRAAGSDVLLRVSNSGPPIPAGGAAALLEPFVRGDGSRTRSDGGLGLGLSIVAAVAAAHGGTVAVTPRPGGGLDVTARLPRGRASRGPEAAGNGPAVPAS
ncbi:sensor histidine kinase [Parafrankia discariae]|uniref:sensor histidine kinase n=1 Tax=Parafrankia discariae TaxID=365528 RepID=UPI00037FEE5E|nr:HAMP domain-containing sensor histidine kinase [Parafrankia discariae]